MKITSESSYTVTTNTFEIETKCGPVVYIEYLNDKNKVIDCNLRAKNTGQEIDNANLLEEIQNFVDAREN